MAQNRDEPERPRVEPEIIPPDRAHRQGWPPPDGYAQARGAHRVYVTRIGPFGFALMMLAIGLFTRLAALIMCVYMAIIVLFFQWQFGYFWTAKGYEYALLWCLLSFAIFFRGGGRYSVDRWLGKEL